MKLLKLIKGLDFNGNPDDCEIKSIIHDSRKVREGSLFIAIKGFKTDGHDYILDAVKNGASAIVSNGRSLDNLPIPVVKVNNPREIMSQISANFYEHPSKELNIIGVTGTNGKTSITQLIFEVFNKSGFTTGALGTLGFATPSGMSTTGFTTPESVEVQHLLKMMKCGGVENAVMEISSHALEMNRVDDVNVNIAIFTNLSQDHLDFHENMENYYLAKLKLFKRLPKSSTAIINIDNAYGRRICKDIDCNIITYGIHQNADLYAYDYELTIESTTIDLKWNGQSFKINSNLIGHYNLENILAVIATSLVFGITIEEIKSAISFQINIPGRMEKFEIDGKGLVIVDYAHTPGAYTQLFKNVKNLSSPNSNLITVFGCGGNRDKDKRSLMGKIAGEYSNKVFITSDNPRNEKVEFICAQITSGFINENYEIELNREKAILSAIKLMDENSILLVLGKGRDDYEEIGNEKFPHSDIGIIKSQIE
jgi:UDP-N-acetylmuramoyl-L-alanyl-D-glutamate--2,6-diaminopimelate ligase